MSEQEDPNPFSGKEYIPIEEHEDKWEDVVPVEQYTKETDPGICKITYTEDFAFVMSYFRALLAKKEISRRMLELTQLVIKVNYACYTAWYQRRVCLDEIGTPQDWQDEVEYLNQIGVDLEKNYQIWHHRRCVVQKVNDASKEKEFLKEIFESDDKNYHAWSYRIWMVQHFNLLEGELEFIHKLIEENPINNSAWSYRYFIINHTKEFNLKTVEEEINYAFENIKNYKLDNEATWVYIRGFLARSEEEAKRSNGPKSSAKKVLITELPFLKVKCSQMLEEYQDGSQGYRFIYILLLDYLTAEGKKEEANEVIEKLETMYDPIRANYWKFRKIS